jgi:peptidyl-prolyl cis-trans isomerase B (cyclophilin B)
VPFFRLATHRYGRQKTLTITVAAAVAQAVVPGAAVQALTAARCLAYNVKEGHMIQRRRILLTIAVALLAAACGRGGNEGGGEKMSAEQPPLPPDVGNPLPRVVLQTNMGTIVMELDREKAPKTVDNIIEHVENHFYDGLIFHRVIPNFMIQTGSFTAQLNERRSPRPPLHNEANNGLKNVRGSVAMARTTDPHSATAGFYINLVKNPNLDFTAETPRGWGYTVFGRVIEGMDVVDAIAQLQTGTQGNLNDVPLRPVIIEKATVAGD